jgi:hypothetical protein
MIPLLESCLPSAMPLMLEVGTVHDSQEIVYEERSDGRQADDEFCLSNLMVLPTIPNGKSAPTGLALAVGVMIDSDIQLSILGLASYPFPARHRLYESFSSRAVSPTIHMENQWRARCSSFQRKQSNATGPTFSVFCPTFFHS